MIFTRHVLIHQISFKFKTDIVARINAVQCALLCFSVGSDAAQLQLSLIGIESVVEHIVYLISVNGNETVSCPKTLFPAWRTLSNIENFYRHML